MIESMASIAHGMSHRLAWIAGIFLFVLCVDAHASTITHTFDITPVATGSNAGCASSGEGQPLDVCGFDISLGAASASTIPGFDASLGTLTRVLLTESISVTGRTSYDRLADSTIEQLGVTISFGLDFGFGVDPNGNFLGIGIAFGASDNACDAIQVGEACSVDWLFESQNDRDITGEAIDFNVDHDLLVQGIVGAHSVGYPRLNPLTFEFTGTPTARFQVIYEYTPVPEPGTAALVGVGLGILSRRRRNPHLRVQRIR